MDPARVKEGHTALHKDFQKIERPRKFFTKGRVFQAPWSELAGPSAPTTRFITYDPFGRRLFTEIRRFVVLRNKPGYSIVVPIHTFGGRAGEKWNSRPQDHCLVFAVDANRTWDRTRLKKKEIPIVVEDPDISIDYPNARINFGKIYTIEDYVMVRPIGFVDKEALPLLEECFRETQGLSDISANPKKHLECTDYNVAYISTLRAELLAARLMLDELHEPPDIDTAQDDNEYVFGTIEGHRIVIATLPVGKTGKADARSLTEPMVKTFRNIEFALLVGIGSGIPLSPSPIDALEDIHLGDVVVGRARNGSSAVVNWKYGVDLRLVGTSILPRRGLLSALDAATSDHNLTETHIASHIARLKSHTQFTRPKLEDDRLFTAEYLHVGNPNSNCDSCDKNELVRRAPRTTRRDTTGFVCHQGIIASGASAVQDGKIRDEIRRAGDRVLCIEIEAAGVNINLPCLVIRGIADYADSHANEGWKFYAAGNAAAFARECLHCIAPRHLKSTPMLLPFARNKNFVGRDLEIAELEEKLASHNDYRRVALYGLGGIGKTHIALEYAYRLKERNPYCAIFWLPAISRESLEQAYMQISDLLQIREIAEENANVRQLVMKRLSEQNSEWLLIIDNDDDIDGSTSDMLRDLPPSSRCSIIFTTRSRKNAIQHAGINLIEVRQMDQGVASRVLERSLLRSVPPSEAAAVPELLARLVNLPLAIIQAASYMNENDISISQYLNLYEQGEDDVIQILSEEFEDSGRYWYMKNPVLKTWFISFESIRVRDTLAAKYLSFMACVVQENIPGSLLPPESLKSTIQAIGTLMAYSFIRRREAEGNEAQFYDMHRLVHLATRSWLKENNQLSRWTEITLMRLIDLIPFGGHEDRETWTPYIPHAVYVANSADISSDKEQSRIDLLDRIGRCQSSIGQYSMAEGTYRQLVELKSKTLGRDGTGTLISMSNLGNVLSKQGKYAEAEKMHRETLALKEKVLGKQHPNTLSSMNSLGDVLSMQGKYVEAEKLHRETLALQEKVLGKEHPETLMSRNNLGEALSGQGKYDETEEMHRETLALMEMVLGKKHPDTLTSMNNLAFLLEIQGKYDEAESISRETLELRKKVLGLEHPDTLTSMSNLAFLLESQGKYDDAESISRETLELMKKVLGLEHPDTLTSMSNLAFLLESQGKYDEVESISRETLELRKKVLGLEHPDTLTSMSNLAFLLENQGKYDEAESISRETLELREKVLGLEHPDTLTSMSNLAFLLKSQGKYGEAESISRQTLQLREKVLGLEHPSSLESKGNSAGVPKSQGKYDEAELILEVHVLDIRKSVLGEKHPDTINAMANLAWTWRQQGRLDEAEPLELQVLDLRKSVLGEKHPDTINAMANLASTRRQQGRLNEAEHLDAQVLDLRKSVLREKHPDTINAMANLASTWRQQGRSYEAEQLDVQVLDLRKIVLGEKHPDTINAMANLASTLRQQERFNEAELLDVQVLELRKSMLGEKHPDTISAMANLASTWRQQGRSHEAEELDVQVLDLRKSMLGEKHPDTVNAMANLASTRRQQGRFNEVEQLDVQVLELRKIKLGEKHPDTISAMANLASTWRQQGRSYEAEQLDVQVLDLRKSMLGEKHPDTIGAMANLALT